MKLIYDIAVMAQLVAACQSANTEIVKAEQLVQQVRSHSDWTCKEKSVIDELMQECKSLVQRMREDQGSFLRVLKEIEGDLTETENSVSNLFSGVESILGKVLAIPVAQTIAAGGGLIGAGAIASSAISGIGAKIGGGIADIIGNANDVRLPDAIGTGWAKDLADKMKLIGSEITDMDLIWDGPGPIIGGIAADVLRNPWNEAWRTNPNVHHNTNVDVGLGAKIIDSIMPKPGLVDIIPPKDSEGIGSMPVAGIVADLPEIANICQTDKVPEIGNAIRVAEQISGVWRDTTTYPADWDRLDVASIGSAVWKQVQDSPVGDVVGDALRNMVEPLAICGLQDLVL